MTSAFSSLTYYLIGKFPPRDLAVRLLTGNAMTDKNAASGWMTVTFGGKAPTDYPTILLGHYPKLSDTAYTEARIAKPSSRLARHACVFRCDGDGNEPVMLDICNAAQVVDTIFRDARKQR